MTTLDDYTSTAARLDAENPLRAARDRFDLPAHESYFLGNSLGPLTHAARAAVLKTVDDEWRNGIVREGAQQRLYMQPARAQCRDIGRFARVRAH